MKTKQVYVRRTFMAECPECGRHIELIEPGDFPPHGSKAIEKLSDLKGEQFKCSECFCKFEC